jgi:hypothetical protein
VLVWFSNYWDDFVVNLDAAAIAKLSLAPGSYLRTHVPAAGVTLVSTFAKSWDDARRLPPPAGMTLDEYGYATHQRMGDWNGAELLFCKRETATARIEHQHQYVWLPAVIDVLDGPAAAMGREFTPADLRTKTYFEASHLSDGFLSMVLSEVLPEVADLEKLPLPKAVDRLDKKLAKLKLTPQGDVSWQERINARSMEATCRLYAGRPDVFAAIMAGDGTFEVMFLSELDDGTWVLTGLADEIQRRIMRKGPTGLPVPNPRVRFQTMDDALAAIFAAHQRALESAVRDSPAKPVAAPKKLDDCVAAFGRFLAVAVD